MDDSEDILVDNVVVNENSSKNVELVELGSSSDEDEKLPLTSRSLDDASHSSIRIVRPILPAWCNRSSMYFQQRFQEARRQRNRRNSNDYEITEVSSEGRLLVNVGKPAADPDVYVTDHLTNILQPHQLQGVKFMYDNIIGTIESYKNSDGEGCILAHSMGLGKTLQVIAFVEIFFRYTGFKRVIIVCPVNTIQNWANEFDRWLPMKDADGKDVRAFQVHLLNDTVKGGLKGRAAFVDNWFHAGGVLLISYDMFKLLTISSDKKSKKKTKPFDDVLDLLVNSGTDELPRNEQIESDLQLKQKLREALVYPGADMIVCDEGHQIKNMKTEKSASLNAVFTKRRIVLTGYPLQNNLWEYYCMVSFVRPGHLGTKKNFREMFEKPINAALGSDADPTAIRLCKMRTHVLQTKLAGFVQRRTQHLLKKILPDSKEYVVFVRKSPIQQRIYRAFVDETNSDIFDQNSSFNPLRAHTICVKVLNHPDMLYYAIEERKKRELSKTSRRRDSDNNSNSNSMPLPSESTPSVIISESRSDLSVEALDEKSNNNRPIANSYLSGLPTSNTLGNYGNNNGQTWPQNPYQHSGISNIHDSSLNSSNFCNNSAQQQQMGFNNFNYGSNNCAANNYWPSIGAPSQFSAYTNQSNMNAQSFQPSPFMEQQQQMNYGGFSSNGNNFFDMTANESNMNGYNNQSSMNIFNNNAQFPLQQSLADSFNFDYSSGQQQMHAQSIYNQHSGYLQPCQQQQQLGFTNDGKPKTSQYSQSREDAFSSHMEVGNQSVLFAEPQAQFQEPQEIKCNVGESWRNAGDSWRMSNNTHAPEFTESVSSNNSIKHVASGRFSNALKTLDRLTNNNSSVSEIQPENGLREDFTNDVPPPVDRAKIVNTDVTPSIQINNDGASTSADDQRPSISAETTTDTSRTKSRGIKGKRMTLGDALLEDDEKIDYSIKLEWTRMPMRDYHPGILENGSKMQLAFLIIDETTRRGEKILFFSSSVNTLNIFETFLCLRTVCKPDGKHEKWRKNINFCRFDGRTSGVERERLINRFNSEPELSLFLISTKAGSLGINLVSASRVIIFEASWNPCDDAQAICRIYRYGQRRQTFIYRLIMNNSMEKAIFHRQIAKSTLQQKVVDHQDIDAKVSTKELETLFQYDEKADFKPIEKELNDWGLEDDLLEKVARENMRLFADIPFLHESLMLESEEKLSEEEKYEAELLYEREMHGGYLDSYSWGGDSTQYGRQISLGHNSDVGGPNWPGSRRIGDSLIDSTGPPRLFPPDFAFSHPAAAAFNRAFRRANLDEESVMLPPQPPIVSSSLIDEEMLKNQKLLNPTPYPRVLRSNEDTNDLDADGAVETFLESSQLSHNLEVAKPKTLSEALNSLITSPTSIVMSSSSSVLEMPCSIINREKQRSPAVSSSIESTELARNDLLKRTHLSPGSLRQPSQTASRPYPIAPDGKIIILKDIKLSSIRSNAGLVELKSGEHVVLCRTANGTYLKTSNGDLLDASDTIYAVPRVSFPIRRTPNAPPEKRKRFELNEVIELE